MFRACVRTNLIHRPKYFISRDVFTLICAFKVYVRPMLEYASCTLSPHHILEIGLQQVETVQRKFTKSLCYKERLSRLDLDSLEMHQLRHDMYTYKIVFNLFSEAANDIFTLANTLYSTRSPDHSYTTNYTCIKVLIM